MGSYIPYLISAVQWKHKNILPEYFLESNFAKKLWYKYFHFTLTCMVDVLNWPPHRSVETACIRAWYRLQCICIASSAGNPLWMQSQTPKDKLRMHNKIFGNVLANFLITCFLRYPDIIDVVIKGDLYFC